MPLTEEELAKMELTNLNNTSIPEMVRFIHEAVRDLRAARALLRRAVKEMDEAEEHGADEPTDYWSNWRHDVRAALPPE